MNQKVPLSRYFRLLIAPPLIACLALCSPVYADSQQVIVHPKVSVSTLSQQSLWAIFAIKQRYWPDGSRIRVFVLPAEHLTHRNFAIDSLKTYPYQLESAWQRLTFSGTGRRPTTVASEQAMIESVSATPGSIGYIGAAANKGATHVVEIE